MDDNAHRRAVETAALDAAAMLAVSMPEDCGFLVLVYSHDTDNGFSVASDDESTTDRHIRIYQETRSSVPPTDVH
jgi:hypothetical protein